MAPLIPTMRAAGFELPEGFNAKTKLVPDWSKLEEEIQEGFAKIEEKVRGKTESGR